MRNTNKIEKLIPKEERKKELTQEIKNKITQYADFSVFIHFEFLEEKHWYQFEKSFDLIKQTMHSDQY
jgi:hypothetical protein